MRRARTPSRTRRLSSARKTRMGPSAGARSSLTAPIGPEPGRSEEGRHPAGPGGCQHPATPPARHLSSSRRHPYVRIRGASVQTPTQGGRSMRIERSVVTISWIPSESVTGMSKAAFGPGPGHYDDPPPEVIDDLDAMRDADAFRFANRLAAWIDVEDGAIVGPGYSGGIVMGATTLTVGGRQATFEAVSLPDIQAEPVVQGDSVTFV